MKTFSNNFRSSLNNARQINGTACYYSNDGYYLLTQENDDSLLTELEEELAIESGYITYDASTIISINPSFKANLYKTICKSVSIEAINKIDKNTNLCVKIGVLVDNSYEYMDYGYFNTIDEPTYKADTKSYLMIGYDKMIESMVKYDDNPLTITYPISHKNLVISICNHFGWSYNLDNYTNYNKIIDKDLYSNQDLTYRDILDDLCQATGTNFLFNLNDVFTTKDITETNTTIDDNYIKDINVSFKEKYGKINALTITSEGTATIDSKEDTDSIALNGRTEFNINNNRLLLYAHDLFIDDLFAKIDGTEFYEFDIDTTGLLVYEPLDRFTINHDSTNYSCVMFGDDVKLTQGLVETIYTDKPTDAKSDYITSAVDDKKINNAIISINKANAQIVLKADSNGKLVQAELNASADGGSQFNVTADNIKLEGYTTINGGFTVDEQGNISGNKSVFKDVKINGGSISLNDNGLTQDATIIVYNKNNTTTQSQTFNTEDLMNGKTLNFDWNALLTLNPNDIVDASGVPNIVTKTLITFSDGSKIIVKPVGSAGGGSSIILIYKIQFINDSNIATDLLYRRYYCDLPNTITNTDLSTPITSLTLSNTIGYVTHIDSSVNEYFYGIVFDSITYQKLLLTNYVMTNSDGLTIKDNDISAKYDGNGINIIDQYGTKSFGKDGLNWQTNNSSNYKEFSVGSNLIYTNLSTGEEYYISNGEMVYQINANEYLKVNTSGITSTAFNNSSLESLKKNFEKLKSGLDIINNSDILKYNYKYEDNCVKKHIGLIIPDLKGNYKTPDEVISQDGKGIDTYSMISIAWKAIQEQQKEIDNLKQKIKKMKECDKND